jgi:hypothetical protein
MPQWKNADQVITGLFLGKCVLLLLALLMCKSAESSLFSIQIAYQSRYLTDHSVTHIVSVCHDEVPAQQPESPIHHFRVPIDDLEEADLLIHLPAACQFIHSALNQGGVVLVHSTLGQSRSAALVSAYCKPHFLGPIQLMNDVCHSDVLAGPVRCRCPAARP